MMPAAVKILSFCCVALLYSCFAVQQSKQQQISAIDSTKLYVDSMFTHCTAGVLVMHCNCADTSMQMSNDTTIIQCR